MSRVDERELRRPVKLFVSDVTTAGCPTCKADVSDTLGAPRLTRRRLAGKAPQDVESDVINVRGYECERCGLVLAIGPGDATVDVDGSDSPWIAVGAVFVDQSKRPVVVPADQIAAGRGDR